MTQELVRENLLKLHSCIEEFTLEFSGRKSGRVNGTYRPGTRHITINNRNFDNNETGANALFYTAMHEFAHHIQFTEHKHSGSRSHTKLFYSILDSLAAKAEELGLYRYDADPDVKALVNEAAEVSAEIAALQRRLGNVLNRLHSVCMRKGLRYEDVVKRKVKISVRMEKKLNKIAALRDLPKDIGFETQEAIAAAKSEKEREAMLEAAKDGKSVAQVKQAAVSTRKEPDELDALVREKENCKTMIEKWKQRLKDIMERIKKLEGG